MSGRDRHALSLVITAIIDTIRTGFTTGRTAAEVAAAAGAGDGRRGRLPAEPDRLGRGGNRPDIGQGGACRRGAVAPNPVNELDCNGWSAKYGTVRKSAGDLCTDPIKIVNGKANRFIDNDWYVGHDEPSVKFISSRTGSGNTMTYLMKMPGGPAPGPAPRPAGSPTTPSCPSRPGSACPVCDPKSYPQNPCTPDSDTNSGLISNPTAAGSAFMELQFYPPGYTPFVDSESCSATKWCAALTIDSLECTFGFATCNANCEEPVNFAYLQTNGVPTGPPSPQLTDVSTFTAERHTLMINPGDVLVGLDLGSAAGVHRR